jgi:hypothetical protein
MLHYHRLPNRNPFKTQILKKYEIKIKNYNL